MDDRIRIALNHIMGNLSLGFTLNDLASIACMSPSHFHRTFKLTTGQTPFRYIEKMKMDKSFDQLLAGSATVGELTNLYGYNDYETFSRTFKKHYAIAPDDLKAISEKIMMVTDVNADSLVIKAFEAEDMNAINNLLEKVPAMMEQIIKERGLTSEELQGSQFLAVLPKEIDNKVSMDSPHVVKNKFIIHLEGNLLEELKKISDNE